LDIFKAVGDLPEEEVSVASQADGAVAFYEKLIAEAIDGLTQFVLALSSRRGVQAAPSRVDLIEAELY
jgi:hypothetical protein